MPRAACAYGLKTMGLASNPNISIAFSEYSSGCIRKETTKEPGLASQSFAKLFSGWVARWERDRMGSAAAAFGWSCPWSRKRTYSEGNESISRGYARICVFLQQAAEDI